VIDPGLMDKVALITGGYNSFGVAFLILTASLVASEAVLSKSYPVRFSSFKKMEPMRIRSSYVLVVWLGVILPIAAMFLLSAETASADPSAADSVSCDTARVKRDEVYRRILGPDWLEPPPVLPVREEDYDRYPRDNFGILFETGHGEMVNSFNDLVTKDMVALPDTTIPLVLTEAELDTLYKKVIEIRFFDYPEPHPPRESNVYSSHNISMVLRVRAGTVEKTLKWKTGRLPEGDAVNDWKRIRQLIKLIREIVWSRPEYRALPSSSGMYI
jgi:hypothetical protein